MLAAVLATSLVTLAGCATKTEYIDSFCLVAAPITPTKAETEQMTELTARQILVHNEVGAMRCGW